MGEMNEQLIETYSGFLARDVAPRLKELGFRRSGLYTYRPQCLDCAACVPVRLDAAGSAPNRPCLAHL